MKLISKRQNKQLSIFLASSGSERNFIFGKLSAALYAEKENIQFDDVAIFEIGENRNYVQLKG